MPVWPVVAKDWWRGRPPEWAVVEAQYLPAAKFYPHVLHTLHAIVHPDAPIG